MTDHPLCMDMRHTGRVKTTHTPPRSVRIPDALWNAAKTKADERGETVTDVIIRALERYVKRT